MAFGKKEYTPAEKQKYHLEMSKKGATKVNPNTGEVYEISDFKRGEHYAKAQNILYARKRAKIRHENNKKLNSK